MEKILRTMGEHVDEYRQNRATRLFRRNAATRQSFCDCRALLEAEGFRLRELREGPDRCYASFSRENEGLFLNFWPSLGEMTGVLEENCPYFSFRDTPRQGKVTPQLTQVHLEDFGMSYTARLSDGRFLVIDGGRGLDPDADRLLECLRRGTPEGKPVIAGWILSHPHPDHFHCFLTFLERHLQEVELERVLLTFPEPEDLAQYPRLVSPRRQLEGVRENAMMRLLQQTLERLQVPVFHPHTGQCYRLGDGTLEVLASMDETLGVSDNTNAASLVLRLELGGQVILWTTDASFEAARLPERYGSRLKADILQAPHHGFGCGSSEAAIAGYRLIAPETVLLPVSDFNAFTAFCAYRECTRFLMTRCGVKELITGEKTRTLDLPYRPDPMGAALLAQSYRDGQENAGARTWIFTGLSAGREEDFVFTALNTTHLPARIRVELFFSTGTKPIRFIEATAGPLGLRQIKLPDGEDVEQDTAFFNPWSLHKNEIPPEASFAVRFMSDIPVVISHGSRQAAYYR